MLENEKRSEFVDGVAFITFSEFYWAAETAVVF